MDERPKESAPRIELVTIGREILDGRVLDTNAVQMAQQLRSRGLVPRAAQRVDDTMPEIVAALQLAATRADVILVTGGLGPTSDDLTAAAAAHFVGEKTQLNQEALAHCKKIIEARGRQMRPEQEKQAWLPPSAKIFANPHGTACGFLLQHPARCGSAHPQQFFFMPGVPGEMLPMFTTEVLPRLPHDSNYRTQAWATQFTSEGELGARLEPLRRTLPADFELSFRTRFPENHIGLHARCHNPERANIYDNAVREITRLLGDDCFAQSQGAESLPPLEEIAVARLRQHKIHLACVESCTGGLLSHRITSVPGASHVLHFSEVTYDNRAKIALGVDSELIQANGAVSEAVARAMAEAGLRKLQKFTGGSQALCLATTGIAGPSGGSAEKPVGLCFVALARTGSDALVKRVQGIAGRTREEYKTLFSQHALSQLLTKY